MYEQMKKEFTKFLKPRGNVSMIVLSVIMILTAAIMFAGGAPFLIPLFIAAVAVMILVLSLRSLLDYPQYIQALEQNGQMQWILQDYSQAQRMLNNDLRFGRYYLYAKGQGNVIAYNDIVRVYQYIHRTNFVEDRRELKYVNKNGAELTLCKLKLRGKSDADLRMVIGMLYQRNPALQVGYHK